VVQKNREPLSPKRSPQAPSTWRGWFVLYNLLIVPLLFVGFQLAAWFAPKVRAGIRGRASLLDEIARQLRDHSPQQLRVWIHAASVGEYEQARPLIRELRQRLPECLIVQSFFSPSIYEHMQKRSSSRETDVVCYLPFDSLIRARRFLRVVQPEVGIFIRHDIWPNHLWEAKRRGVLLMLASASVHERSLRHLPILRSFNRAVFDCFDVIAATSADTAKGMKKFVRFPERLMVAGDTRYDQVLFRSREPKLAGVLPTSWQHGAPTLIAGSVWPEDAAVLIPAFAAARRQVHGLRLMIVPHEPTPEQVHQLEAACGAMELNATVLSRGAEGARQEVLIVDRMGILANLYGVGQAAFVGGSFGPGIHNVLEAAIHGIPVLFGPRMRNSPEAIAMAEKGIGLIMHDATEGAQVLLVLFGNEGKRRELAERSRAFVLERCGASTKLIDTLLAALQKEVQRDKSSASKMS